MQLVQFLAVSMSGSNREDAMVIGVRRDGAVYFGAERVRSDEVAFEDSQSLEGARRRKEGLYLG
jgi:hypothetical protein